MRIYLLSGNKFYRYLFRKNKYIWRLKIHSMKLKKYLSKQLILRFCLILALVGGAMVFDMYHAANQKIALKTRTIPASHETDNNKTFFCYQVPNYNLKTSATEFSIRFRNTISQNKFLIQYYNLRTFQLMKAEAVQSSFPALCSFHSLPFNRVLYSSPDDIPPLS
jgi:hypothetical protein